MDRIMVNKKYCMSSYLAFRYIEKPEMEFKEGFKHSLEPLALEDEIVPVSSAEEMDAQLKKTFKKLEGKRMAIFLSGGMDSAILASYMPGCDAYTFRFLGGEYHKEELARAEYYADYYHLNLHYIDITWDTVINHLEPVMKAKCAPVHSIEPQLLQAALQAKEDGAEVIILGESADSIFGGLDGLLAKDWTIDEFKQRYMFTNPADVLVDSEDMSYLFERYRKDGDKIDFQAFIKDVFGIESGGSYINSFGVAGLEYFTPFAFMKVKGGLDLERIRKGDTKYLIRDLFRMKYPRYPVPEKIPMPRPVDAYLQSGKAQKDQSLSRIWT